MRKPSWNERMTTYFPFIENTETDLYVEACSQEFEAKMALRAWKAEQREAARAAAVVPEVPVVKPAKELPGKRLAKLIADGREACREAGRIRMLWANWKPACMVDDTETGTESVLRLEVA